MQKQFISAIEQICEEKNIPKEMVLEAVEAALAAAYKKDFGDREQEVRVELDPESGEAIIYISKEVVKEVENGKLQISLKDAKKIKKGVKIGDVIEIKEDNKEFGRVAAQTAKQVIVQRIREAERDVVFNEYSGKEGTIINATVQRFENNNAYIDLGKATGIMFPNDQIPNEKYYPGQRIKVYIVRVEQTNKGPQIIVSRSHPEMIRKLFEMEVPEIANGTVEIVDIAREAGARTKIAVKSNVEGVDPVGTFVGGRGTRVQAVMSEIGEEKIDIIAYNDDPAVYITNALSPTKVMSVKIDKAQKKALVKVPEDQLSLAIGKAGQNVRLAAKLTGWNVDIDGADEAGIEATAAVVGEPSKNKKLSGEPKSPKITDLEEALIAVAENQKIEGETKKEQKETKETSDSVSELPAKKENNISEEKYNKDNNES